MHALNIIWQSLHFTIAGENTGQKVQDKEGGQLRAGRDLQEAHHGAGEQRGGHQEGSHLDQRQNPSW